MENGEWKTENGEGKRAFVGICRGCGLRVTG